MKEIRIGKWQPLGGIRIRSLAVNVLLLLLGVANALASVFEWYEGVGMMIFNGVCVIALVVAVMHKVLTMEPRKKWRVLSFLLSGFGVMAIFCGQIVEGDIEKWLQILLCVVGNVLLVMGGISIVRWRRYSLARREQLESDRSKRSNN